MKRFAARLPALLLAGWFVFSALMPTALAEPKFDDKDAPADAVLLIDTTSGMSLYDNNEADERIYPASTTKLLTALIVMDKTDLSKTITVGKEVNVSSGSSKVGFDSGEKVTIKDLLYGMMVASGNDAANALAVHLGKTIAGFADMMNDEAEKIGMEDSHFVNPHGLHDDEHYTTANDMRKLLLYALKKPGFKELICTKEYKLSKTNKHDEARTLKTTNKLFSDEEDDKDYRYKYAIGGKTGLTTPSTGKYNGCLVALAEKDGMSLAALIFGDHTKNGVKRWSIAKKLFEFGFDNYETVDIKSIIQDIYVTEEVKNASDLDEAGGMMEFAPVVAEGVYYTGEKSFIDSISQNKESITPVPEYTKELEAPIQKGDVYGTITYKLNDEPLYSCDLAATRDMAAFGETPSASASQSGPVSTQQKVELFAEQQISPWWWLLLPVALILFIVIRVITLKKKHRSRFKNKRKVYNYRIR